MPTEVRRIRFAAPEIEVAMTTLARREGALAADQRVRGLRLSHEPEATVTLIVGREDGGGGSPSDPQHIPFQRAKVTEALIRFCLDRGIPLPMAGRKVLLLEAEVIVLAVTLGDGGNGRPNIRLVREGSLFQKKP